MAMRDTENNKLSNCLALLDACKMPNLFMYISSLQDKRKQQLLVDQICKSDIRSLIKNLELSLTIKQENTSYDNSKIKPVKKVIDLNIYKNSSICCFDMINTDESTVSFLYESGLESLLNQEIAVVIFSGGLASRFGENKPKGCHELNLPSKSTIFALQAKKLVALQKKIKRIYNKSVDIPLCIMCGETNVEYIQEYFRSNDNLGLNKIFYFIQSKIPAFDLDTKEILLEDDSNIKYSPDGNGTFFRCFHESGLIQKLKQIGCKYVQVSQVDNILANLADPKLVGLIKHSNKNFINVSVKKQYAEQKVGMVVSKIESPEREHLSIVEYTEVSSKISDLKDENNELVYQLASICNLIMKIDMIKDYDLKYHVAFKKLDYFDFKQNKPVKPTEINAIKLEKFIIDIFDVGDSCGAVLMDQKEIFAPIKSMEGIDSAVSALELLSNLHRNYLQSLGIQVDENAHYEIEPGQIYDIHDINQAIIYKKF